jgi:hypothetical protein
MLPGMQHGAPEGHLNNPQLTDLPGLSARARTAGSLFLPRPREDQQCHRVRLQILKECLLQDLLEILQTEIYHLAIPEEDLHREVLLLIQGMDHLHQVQDMPDEDKMSNYLPPISSDMEEKMLNYINNRKISYKFVSLV